MSIITFYYLVIKNMKQNSSQPPKALKLVASILVALFISGVMLPSAVAGQANMQPPVAPPRPPIDPKPLNSIPPNLIIEEVKVNDLAGPQKEKKVSVKIHNIGGIFALFVKTEMYIDTNNDQMIDSGDICLGNSFLLWLRAGRTTTVYSQKFTTNTDMSTIMVKTSCIGEVEDGDNNHVQLFHTPQ
jgi:hypothetical protein